MKYITLVCAAGMSTSLLVNKMRRTAAAEGLEAEIMAMADFAFLRYEKPTDVLLLGPQVGYRYDELKEKFGPEGIPVAVIDSRLYAAMDAEAVLHMALDMIQKRKRIRRTKK